LTRLPHLKCIRLGSVRSSHLPFKKHKVGYVRSSLPILMHVGSVAAPKKIVRFQEGNFILGLKLIASAGLRRQVVRIVSLLLCHGPR